MSASKIASVDPPQRSLGVHCLALVTASPLQAPLIGMAPPKATEGEFPVSPIPAVNVACVPQRSPLRYPGGKTWLVPHIRAWLGALRPAPRVLLEPFAGGGIVSLTAVMENLVGRCVMAELDREVAAFWHAALRDGDALARLVRDFDVSRDAVVELSEAIPRSVVEHGFRTLVLNRTRRGGILAPGASLSRAGEAGKGVASRWYPQTLVRRLQAISATAERLAFCEADGLKLLESFLAAGTAGVAVFVDPPYTAGGKRAGKRLYAHNELDHRRLFEVLASSGVDFLMTCDRAPEVEAWVREFGFSAVQVVMKNTHHDLLPELVISSSPVFEGVE